MEGLKDNITLFKDLKRKVKLTRSARILASKRLRKSHEYYEKISNFYSVLLLILAVWFMNVPEPVESLLITKILLVLSLSLTFFTMFLNIKNYKERAGNFETNYQHLDILLNKIERLEVNCDCITSDIVKGLHREYEKLIIDKENHLDIDYMNSSLEIKEKYKKEIKKYNLYNKIINILVGLYPVILVVIIYFINSLLEMI